MKAIINGVTHKFLPMEQLEQNLIDAHQRLCCDGAIRAMTVKAVRSRRPTSTGTVDHVQVDARDRDHGAGT